MNPSRLLRRLHHFMWNEILYPIPPAGATNVRAPEPKPVSAPAKSATRPCQRSRSTSAAEATSFKTAS